MTIALPVTLQRYRLEDRGHETPCWIWTGALKPEGYAEVTWKSRGGRNAHRLVYEHLVGPIPSGLHIDHLCRQRECVNPHHLEPVTCAENIRRGHGTKITLDDAREIRRRCANGEPQIQVAAEYGVHSAHISKIVRGHGWREAGIEPNPYVRPPRPVCAECGAECPRAGRRFCSKRCVMLARHRADPELRMRAGAAAGAARRHQGRHRQPLNAAATHQEDS